MVDYEAVASRFLDGQTYLHDLIHPGTEVGLELANILLNYVDQVAALRGADGAGKRGAGALGRRFKR